MRKCCILISTSFAGSAFESKKISRALVCGRLLVLVRERFDGDGEGNASWVGMVGDWGYGHDGCLQETRRGYGHG